MLKVVCDAEGCTNETEIEFEHHLPPRWVKMEFQMPDKPLAPIDDENPDEEDPDDEVDREAMDGLDPYSQGFMRGRGAALRRNPNGPHTHVQVVICPSHNLPAIKGKVLRAARGRFVLAIGA